MNAVIMQFLKEGVELKVALNTEEEMVYIFEGFYKYGEVRMINRGDYLECKTRYNIVKEIKNWEEMVEWNLDVQDGYKNAFSGWRSVEFPFCNYIK